MNEKKILRVVPKDFFSFGSYEEPSSDKLPTYEDVETKKMLDWENFEFEEKDEE